MASLASAYDARNVVNVNLPAKLTWHLRRVHTGPATVNIETSSKMVISRKETRNTISRRTTQLNMSVNWEAGAGLQLKAITGNAKHSVNLNAAQGTFQEVARTVSENTDYEKVAKYGTKITVPAGQQRFEWECQFTAPTGTVILCTQVLKKGEKPCAVLTAAATMQYSVPMVSFLKGIRYVRDKHRTNMPSDAVQEIDHPRYDNGNDINKGMGGPFLWFVVERTNKLSEALTGFTFVRSGSREPGRSSYDDLAQGCGGDFRYLIPERTPGCKAINPYTVTLWRSPHTDQLPRQRKYDNTPDLNAGRGGDYLYLCWKTGSTKIP